MQRHYTEGEEHDGSFVLDTWGQKISEDASDAVLEHGGKLVSFTRAC